MTKSDGKERARRRFFNLLKQGTEALQKGQTSRAVQLLARAHAMDEENVDAALNLGAAYILSKKFSKAVVILEPLSQRDPHNPMVWTNLGAAYLGNPVLARDEEQLRAIAALTRAFELNPATPNVAYNLGLIHRDRQEYEKALHWFQSALQANPNDRDARRCAEQMEQKIADQ